MTRNQFLSEGLPFFEDAYEMGVRGVPADFEALSASFPVVFERVAGYAADAHTTEAAQAIYRIMGLMYEKGQQDAGKEAQL